MMRDYASLPPFAMTIFGVAAICIAVVAAFTLVYSCAHRLDRRSKTFAVAGAVGVVFMMQVLSDICAQMDTRGSLVAVSGVIGRMPVIAVILVLLILALLEVALARDVTRKLRNMLTENSIKESLDGLPDGVCFSTKDGQALLVNARMNEISMRVFGSVVMNVVECEGRLRRHEFNDCVEIISYDEASTVLACGGSVWNIRVQPLESSQGQVVETLAFDVTDRYELSRELENNNRILTDVNNSLRDYSRRVHQLAREEEILAAKTKVHDDIGRSLLSFRAYLTQPVSERNRTELLRLWSHDIRVMKHEADPAPPKDEWELLQGAAEAVGVRIVLDGELPGPGRERSIFITALHECLTNTVRHAHGTRVTMEIDESGTTDKSEAGAGSETGMAEIGSRTGAGITARITNDGEQPSGAIAETGGLGNLRVAVERAGGNMEITSSPEFILQITLPREES